MSSQPVVLLCKWQDDFVREFLASGARMYVILAEDDLARKPDPDLLAACAHVYRIGSFDSLEELGAIATDLTVRGVTVDRVISQSEYTQYAAGYLDLLLRPGRSDPLAHVSTRDKRLMKARVAAAGVRTAAWRSISDPASAAERAAVAAALRFPIIVKPAAGAGTMSTVRVEDAGHLHRALDGFAYEPRLLGAQLIAEEFVPGRELHVEGLWAKGKPLFFVVGAYRQPRLDTLVNKTVAGGPGDGSEIIPESTAPELYRRLLELNLRVNAALGITDEVTQLEAFETPTGELVFSELAARAGGGWVQDMVSEYLGDPFWRAIGEGLATGALTPRAPRPRPGYIGGAHLAPALSGRIVSMPRDEALRSIDGVVNWHRMKSAGDFYRASHAADWCLFVIISTPTRERYEEALARLAKEAVIEVDPAVQA